MVCLGTDILIHLLKGDPRARAAIRGLEEEEAAIATTVINRYELLKGAHASLHPQRNLKAARELLAGLHSMDFDSQIAEAGAKIFTDLMRGGRMVNEMDVLIAAVCVARNEVLVSNDSNFRRIQELRVRGW